MAWPASAVRAQGSVGMVLWEWQTGWSLELTLFHGPNMVICKVVSGTSPTLIIVAYLLTSTLDHLPNLEEDLARFWGKYPIMLGYINMDLDEDQNPRS